MDDNVLQAVKEAAAKEYGVPADRLKGSTPEEIAADAVKLKELLESLGRRPGSDDVDLSTTELLIRRRTREVEVINQMCADSNGTDYAVKQ